MTELDDHVITEFRANAGVVLDAMGGHFKNVHLLLLHHTGRRSGRLYVTPLLYVEDGDRHVLIGSNGGAEREPAWVAYVAAMPEVAIHVGEQTLTAKPTILREGPEWDRLHAAAVALLAQHLRIPDPHHPHLPVHRPGPDPGSGPTEVRGSSAPAPIMAVPLPASANPLLARTEFRSLEV